MKQHTIRESQLGSYTQKGENFFNSHLIEDPERILLGSDSYPSELPIGLTDHKAGLAFDVNLFPEQLPGFEDQFYDPRARKPYVPKGYTHGLRTVRGVGYDGEVNSGFVELTEITLATGGTCAAIRAWSFRHHTGLPSIDTSWMLEFDNTAMASEFWKMWSANHNGGVSFLLNDALMHLDYFEEHHGLTPETSGVHVQELGLLAPWYLQKPNDEKPVDRVIYPSFKQDSVPLSEIIDKDGIERGKVYLVPDTQLLPCDKPNFTPSALVNVHAVRHDDLNVLSRGAPRQIAVQWDDGRLRYYAESDTTLPVPLTADNIAA